MLGLMPGGFEFLIDNLSQWVMFHRVDYSTHSRHSIIVPGVYHLAIHFPSTVLIVKETHHMCAKSPSTEQHGVPPDPAFRHGPRNSASVWGAHRSVSSCHAGLRLPTRHRIPQGPSAGPTPPHLLSSDKVQNINSILGLESSRVNLQGA